MNAFELFSQTLPRQQVTPIHDPGIVAHPLELPRLTPKRPFSTIPYKHCYFSHESYNI